MPRPGSAIAAELLGFHSYGSCLKLNEDCLKKFVAENAKKSQEQLKGLTEDVAELTLIIRTTDKLVGGVKDFLFIYLNIKLDCHRDH